MVNVLGIVWNQSVLAVVTVLVLGTYGETGLSMDESFNFTNL